MPIRLEIASLDTPAAQALIAALNAELDERYPEAGANHVRLDPDEVAPGRGAFVVAMEGDEPLGCGAVRLIAPGLGEVKRMYVVPAARGQKIGRMLLDVIEAAARGLGIRRLVLETGERQHEAIGLYERAGFTRIARFGEYVDSPLSVCMGKDLV